MKPVTLVAASAPAAQRFGRSAVGGSLATLNVSLLSPRVGQRRHWQDPALLRRRRLVCSAADCDVDAGGAGAPAEDPDKDNDDVNRSASPSSSSSSSNSSSPAVVRRGRGRARDPVREDLDVDLGVLDVPVTPATPNGGGRRALWCETMEVQRSGLLERLNSAESALQEAKFEVLSSEESYLRSLDMLAHRVEAIDAMQDPGVMSAQERDALTTFLDTARACSMRLVSALRALWSLDVMMRGLCTLMHKETMPAASLQQYVLIVGLQPRAASVLGKIGSLEANQLIPLLSLPAQRASRLPLLLAAILRRLDQRTSEAVICRAALDRLNQIVFECNEALRRAEQTERMAELGRILKVEKVCTSLQIFMSCTSQNFATDVILFAFQTSTRKQSWSERKNNVIGRAKSFFLKSNSRISSKTSKILTSTSSMLHLT
ncbi:hypothetical protein ONE63_008770 [Megalurothrips usitatus]|uniref:DH domain-containing protein n=1 Tax=Megalurothrips usitatus TaxID=439358 RepID=A0AAV7XM78_9NEOP|nr:hypothetical protein ONE63_008770 [Megalurothrips usitatus]